ncbi:metallophosphoesterase [Jatrophihabitans sp. GAS493]|uniref:metallophosphoesterase n=1 Tax=Jatrophihabitans sp. GAS493 TaxID=1907575 RepID=UPI000BB841AC|nr:metallophosphoesterase [Jatrophihabitans sp. GAS493]
MTAHFDFQPDRIAVAGDWHGNLWWAQQAIDRAAAAQAQVIVQLGDFGFWTMTPATRKFLQRLEARLDEHNIRLLFVDGNHEDHDRLNARPINPDTGLRLITDHIHHLPRGVRWT